MGQKCTKKHKKMRQKNAQECTFLENLNKRGKKNAKLVSPPGCGCGREMVFFGNRCSDFKHKRVWSRGVANHYLSRQNSSNTHTKSCFSCTTVTSSELMSGRGNSCRLRPPSSRLHGELRSSSGTSGASSQSDSSHCKARGSKRALCL